MEHKKKQAHKVEKTAHMNKENISLGRTLQAAKWIRFFDILMKQEQGI